MKITTDRLRQIIKEELEKTLNELGEDTEEVSAETIQAAAEEMPRNTANYVNTILDNNPDGFVQAVNNLMKQDYIYTLEAAIVSALTIPEFDDMLVNMSNNPRTTSTPGDFDDRPGADMRTPRRYTRNY